MTYLPAILDVVTVALFGWLLVALLDWGGQWLYDRRCERERQADIDATIARWMDEDKDFARLQKQIREGEK